MIFFFKEIDIVWAPSQEVKLMNEISNEIVKNNLAYNVFKCGEDVEIQYVTTDDILDTIIEQNKIDSVVRSEQNHSDLIPGVYEGL